MQLADVTALVTGAASGLGRATVERLAAAGASVVMVDLASSAGAAVATDLGAAVQFVPADVGDPDAIAGALDAAAALDKPMRVVVNCAGIAPPAKVVGRDGPFPLELFRRVIEVNLVGTFNVIRLAAERMIALPLADEERGVIICTASVAAYEGQIGQAAYSASKGGIVSMTLPIARELAQHQIRIVTIAPGLFETPLLASLPAEAMAALGQQVPHPNRLGRAPEYAALVDHIIANPMLNGETIRLDGAIRMAPR